MEVGGGIATAREEEVMRSLFTVHAGEYLVGAEVSAVSPTPRCGSRRETLEWTFW